jgi:hypothetical protein
MEFMLTVPVEDWIVFLQICPIILMYCKSVTTKRLCCICNIYYCACIKNEDTTGVVKPKIKGHNVKKKRDKETL